MHISIYTNLIFAELKRLQTKEVLGHLSIEPVISVIVDTYSVDKITMRVSLSITCPQPVLPEAVHGNQFTSSNWF